jgi:amino acid transporter
MNNKKAFGLWSAIFLGIGSMVGAGIFIVIGQAGSIAGNLVWFSFILGGAAALLSGYSLAKMAVAYPSRGGMVEYLVQGYGEGLFSGSIGILFYFSQLITIAAVSKAFGVYAVTFVPEGLLSANVFALGVVGLFIAINLIGAAFVSKAENIIVFIKLTILLVFVGVALFYVDPKLLSTTQMPAMDQMFFAVGLTFFAYQGFSVITNTVEDMQNPEETMLKAMTITIILVGLLYVLTSVAVLGNMSLPEVLKAQDYALAQVAEPIFGSLGFKIMAATALLATASAINATLYAATEIGYTLAKEGNLPKVYTYNIHESYEGLIISGVLIIPMILFLNLAQITSIAAIVVLIIQGITHMGHLFCIEKTGANRLLIVAAIVSMFSIAGLTLYYTSVHEIPMIGVYILCAFVLAFVVEAALRYFTKRVVNRHMKS